MEQANPVSIPKQASELHCGKHVQYTLDKGVPTVYINGDTDVCPPSISTHGGGGILIGFALGLLDPPFNLHCAIISTNLGKEVNGRSVPYICVPIESVRLGKPQFDSTILTTRYKIQSALNSVCRRISATPAFIEAALKVHMLFATMCRPLCASVITRVYYVSACCVCAQADKPPHKEGPVLPNADGAAINVDKKATNNVAEDQARPQGRAGIGNNKKNLGNAVEGSNEVSGTGTYGLRSKGSKKNDVGSGGSNAEQGLDVKSDSEDSNEDPPDKAEKRGRGKNKRSKKSKTAPDDLKNWGQRKLLTLGTPELKRLADLHKVMRPRSGDEASKRATVLKLCA